MSLKNILSLAPALLFEINTWFELSTFAKATEDKAKEGSSFQISYSFTFTSCIVMTEHIIPAVPSTKKKGLKDIVKAI